MMNQTVTYILFLLSVSAIFGKYVYIEKDTTWHKAQEYCRQFYTDLAPVSNKYDTSRLRKLAGDTNYFIWIGMERESTNRKKWMWSGGGSVSTFFWARSQPNNRPNENYGVMIHSKWHDSPSTYKDPFFCYNVVVVRKRKTWEEALWYCRKNHRDLASIASETEMLLIQKELGKNLTTEHVWIGLHFFPGRWLWVDGQPFEYEAWGEKGEPSCPKVNLECGALQATGRLPVTNDTLGTGAANLNYTGNHGHNISDVEERVWEARDCEERLHFLCY